ncbi:MAG TPA: hypothetical protein VGF97_16865 [Rhizomicrobium sp.]|jgi:hypothetical protein
MSTNQAAEHVRALTERLTTALEADIAALEKARPQEMRSVEPEMQQLAAVYAREAQALRAQLAQSGAKPPPALVTATKAFRDALNRQTRMLTRLRGATEGMIRAIAEDVEKRRSVTRPYGASLAPGRQPNALLYNNVA